MSERDYDVIIWDNVSTNWKGGGSEKQTLLLMQMLRKAGLRVWLTGTHVDFEMTCRTLIVNRYSTVPAHIQADRTVVAAHDQEPYTHMFPHAYLSNWQACRHGHFLPTDVVIPGIMPDEYFEIKPEPREGTWCYASSEMKGWAATKKAWDSIVRPQQTLHAYFAGQRPHADLVQCMARCEGMFYRNTYPECFPMVVSIAKLLGLKLDIQCHGHLPCGIEAARTARPEDMRAEVLLPKWLAFLKL